MPTPKFPGPNYNSVIESDPQIKRIDLNNMEWGARKSGMPGGIKNEFVVKHVESNK
jgi:hypothetical protein